LPVSANNDINFGASVFRLGPQEEGEQTMEKLRHFSALLFPVLFVAVALCAKSPKPKVEHKFSCSPKICKNGAGPLALIQASDGNFYGVTTTSVDGQGKTLEGGTIFSLTPAKKLALLHTFTGGNTSADGSRPNFLMEGVDGDLYGTTSSGGGNFVGVLFRIARDGSGFTVLHAFCQSSGCPDGALPTGLANGPDGNVYGVTFQGGSNDYDCSFVQGCGVFFSITASTGAFQVLTVLDGSNGFAGPLGLTLASDGNFYGAFGIFDQEPIFKVDTTGVFTLVANLPGLDFPFGVVQGANGDLYGTLENVEDSDKNALFEVGLDGSNLQVFPELAYGYRLSAPIAASNGNLWSTYSDMTAGTSGIMELSAEDGSLLETLPFTGNFANPTSLLQASDGIFWGNAAGTADFYPGLVFSLNESLPPR
jgi:uncharacterized repeat protein (TIGR03803 family)